MKNRDIYKSALGLLAQNISGDDTADLEERAPYLLANFCMEVAELDRVARKLLGLDEVSSFSKVLLSLDEDFPLLDRFAALAVKYLAAMLVIDEDSELSDRLYAMYCDGVSLLKDGLPSVIESIKDKYL